MKKLLTKILIALNVIIILGMLVTGFAFYLTPVTWGWLAEAGYGYGIPLILNLVMIAVWVFFRLRYVFIPLLGMVVCYYPTMSFCPINMSQTAPEDCIKVMSYNTLSFGAPGDPENGISPNDARRMMIEYIKAQNCDIVCLQEATLWPGREEEIREGIQDQLPHIDTIMSKRENTVTIFSRYPIVRKERIEYESQGNVSGAFTVLVNGKEVVVVNNHLETNALSPEEKESFSTVVHGEHGKKAIARESKFILSKLTNAAKKRAPQAEAVASFIRMHKNKPLIVCGDFNDIPLSYAHYTIARDITDCYTATGLGTGVSYNKNSMPVRIDNIMCSEHFTPYDCKVQTDITLSDHYPITCLLKLSE